MSMQLALDDAGLSIDDIGYINAHGTSTQLNDKSETAAIKTVFGEQAYQIPVSSTKSMTGHLLGASGALEAVFCILAMRDQIAPPTLNLDNPSEGTEGVDLVPHKAKERKIRAVLNNSFGFGGTNASLIMKAVD